MPAFEELGPEPSCKVSEHGYDIVRENVVGITTKQLTDNMNQQGMTTSISLIYENYLRPLIKQGVINSVRSNINGKENIYFPVNHDNQGDLSSSSSVLHLTEDCRLIVNSPFDEKKILEESLGTLLGRRSNGCSNKYKIIDIDGSEITIEDLIEKYYFNEKYHTLCSVVLVKPSNNNATEDESSTIERQTKDNQENENEEQDLDASINRFVNSPTNIIKTFDSSCYQYSEDDIEEFFFSNMGQQKEHTLEESICRPLIGQQISKPFFYYCKEDPTVEYLHLESIEYHIRLKDPERHKSKLLELLREEEIESEEKSDGLDNKNKDSLS